LRWQKAYKGLSPPILLAGEWRTSDAEGILLDWQTPTLTFDLAHYPLTPDASRRQLALSLRHAPELADFFQAAQQYQQKKQYTFEHQIGMPLDHFALVLGLWSVLLGGQGLLHALPEMVRRLNLAQHIPSYALPEKPACLAEWQQFFRDVFSHPVERCAQVKNRCPFVSALRLHEPDSRVDMHTHRRCG
jgi:hypothetical protein